MCKKTASGVIKTGKCSGGDRAITYISLFTFLFEMHSLEIRALIY